MKNIDKANPVIDSEEYDIALTSADINALPISRYEGPIEIPSESGDIRRACKILMKEALLGFDTETRPSFRKGISYNPSLIQLAGAQKVYLFQIKNQRIPTALKALLSDDKTLKAGVSLAYDLKQLRAMDEFEPGGFISLEALTRPLRIKNQGLRGLTAALFGFRISKRAQCSNWSQAVLTDAQINYAATDAWISRCLYIEMSRRLAEQEKNSQ